MKRIITNLMIFTTWAWSMFAADHVLAQTRVIIPGTFQSELGCSSDWLADCNSTALTFNPATGLWTGTFKIPAGCHQYKVAIDGSWNINYGETGIQNGANIQLSVPAETSITFSYNPSTHLVQTSPIASGFSTNCLPQVVLVGEFQNELGCNFDWDANCTNTAFFYNAAIGKFERDLTIPPNISFGYRVVLNGDWANNFGNDGTPNGSNYFIYVPCQPTRIHFSYDPITHIVTANPQPATVVVAGSFQSELGCAGDWQPNCDNTRLSYNPDFGIWTDTFDIPAGHWEYKITINNSWAENYGLNGEPDGANIPLDLCYPAKVAFTYYHSSCFHYAYAQIITNGVCLNKFYDANVNGYPDPGEEPMGGVQFTLSGNGIKQIQTTGSDGKAAFTNLPDGLYLIKETVPSAYYAVTDSQFVYVFGGNAIANFGNVCLGDGGAKGLGFWSNKNSEAALNNAGKMEHALSSLREWSLRNADGSDFDPASYSQLRGWLLGANAKNMTYMLSAQLAAMFLNTEMGWVDRYNDYIYTPGCGFWGNGNFMNIDVLLWYTNYYLLYRTTVNGKDPDRAYLECLKNAFDNANNNLTFVQSHPCGAAITNIERRTLQEINVISPTVKIWPNPSNNYFILRPSDNGNKQEVELKIYNVNGQQVFMASGSSNKDYHFGENFTPGIYMAEFIQGNTKKTFKLVKQ